MNCDQIEVWISAYQDGELTERRQRLVEEHLATCHACRSLADDMLGLATALRADMKCEEAPATLHERVMRQIPGAEPAPVATSIASMRNSRRWLSFSMVPFGATAAWLFMAARPVPLSNPIPVSPTPATQARAAQPGHGTSPLLVELPSSPAHPETATVGLRGPEKRATEGSKHPRLLRPELPRERINPPHRSREEYRPEMEVLRRLRLLRPRRRQYPVARLLHRRRPLLLVSRPTPASVGWPHFASERPAPLGQTMPRLCVVDYVLPQAETPPSTEEAGTEFVLRSANPVQLTQATWEF